MSVTLEFRYNAQDMPEALKVASKHIRRQQIWSRTSLNRLASWLVFVFLLLLLAYATSRQRHQNRMPTASPATWNDYFTDVVAPALPWFVLAFAILLVNARRRRSPGKATSLDDLRTLTANDDGLIWTEAAMKVEYRWNAFHGFAETPKLFVLYQDDARQAQRVRILVVPKRAFPSSDMLLEFTGLLTAHARVHDGAFPITPIKPLAVPPVQQKSPPDFPVAPH